MDAYFGEIRIFANNFCPADWLPCAGQTLQIRDYQALYAVIGIIYGGDGQTTFKVPNLQGMAVAGATQTTAVADWRLGKTNGANMVALNTANLPYHNHLLTGATGGGTNRTSNPGPTSLLSIYNYNPNTGASSNAFGYTDTAATTTLNQNTLTPSGVVAPNGHENRSPHLAVNYFICALNGYFPARP